ncbi:small CPxCG-related zinc finger protein [Natronomonas moolapensis 8.8.11]|uniref:Small CPxCG-related zinc finger protein n=1 Tax=Natronomonas moolapensis (strain DSM 18674 / CECT 7526 / JCM 14361 / 8.8.11) TaxID=268739 RepID=M1Y5H6_NATM8|nr:rubrerythrin-like domain-containing protein [Natronomonas moolapensis]CCQ37818.1 small CPxCG-related zinc finger protein [Natronomonas moolapensis 8.8.11]
MRETDPDHSEGTVYVCRECGTGVKSAGQGNKCPDCGGPMRNTAVPHD